MKKTSQPVSKTKPYKIWHNMQYRVKNNPQYYTDIMVCSEWQYFKDFWNDMQSTYKKGLFIGRIDMKKGYSKENCKWVTRQEQQNRKINNVNYTHKGETHTRTEWSRITGIPYNTLKMREVYGWSVQKMLTPLKFNKIRPSK